MPLPRLRFCHAKFAGGETVQSRRTGHPDCFVRGRTAVCSPAFRGAASTCRWRPVLHNQAVVCLPRCRRRFRRRAVTSSGLGGSGGIRLVARSSAVTRFAWFMVWSLSFSVRWPRFSSYLFLVVLNCGHCRATLLPFGTVGNGRFAQGGGLFIAKLVKQRAILLPRAVRARQFFLAAAAHAWSAQVKS